VKLSRRAWLAGACATVLAPRAHAHSNAGPVSPAAPPPGAHVTLDDGKAASLHKLLAGHVTALQMVFTRCRATCPIQGALFSTVQKELGDTLPDARLLSISIDPEHDDPKTLKAWLERYEASGRWRAGRVEEKELSPLLDFLKARATGPDRHTAQIYFFDRAGQLTMRSVDFPPASEVAGVLGKLAAKG
jgi:protein SCO1